MNQPRAYSALIVLVIALTHGGVLDAQEIAGPDQSVGTILEQIRELESNRDPKCYATAARLEDFMFGTPLTEEARFAKTDVQKTVIARIWRAASSIAKAAERPKVTSADVEAAMSSAVSIERLDTGDVAIRWSDGQSTKLTRRDVEHYMSIAYGYRAVLAVQQMFLLDGDPPLPLDDGAVRTVREAIDLLTLAALERADRSARLADRREIDAPSMVLALRSVAPSWLDQPSDARPRSAPADMKPFALTRRIIQEKVTAFEAYNQISTPVFMRNLQVYFARFRWPRDPAEGEAIKTAFNESMIAFVEDILRHSAALAARENEPFILVRHVHEALQTFVPYRVNEYEDVVYFPSLPRADRIVLESYDTDAFRDSGLHWRYLDAAVDGVINDVAIEPDPFAAELITEGVAQFGVLVLRVSGMLAQEQDAEYLAIRHLAGAFQRIQSLLERSKTVTADVGKAESLASSNARTVTTGIFFTDVTSESGIAFEHRSSDWLSRLLRSYLRRSETEGTITIPPAFGGAGVAAGDLDGDGDHDILILGGLGNRLYANRGDGTFDDVTPEGFTPLRSDKTPGEPRQPVFADFDNDGRPDILITFVDQTHRLFRNLGDLRFEDVSARAGLGGEGLVAGPATVADFDNDGLLDIYIGYFGNFLRGTLPNLSRRNLNGSPNQLFLNSGNFRFRNATTGSGTDNSGWTQALSHTDLDGDGLQDIIVGNDFGVNAYLKNLGNGRFEDVADKIGTGKPSFTMNVGFADLNADDRPDVYISNIVTMVKDEKYVLPSEETEMKFDPAKLARMRVVEANDLFLSRVGADGSIRYELSDLVGRGFSSTGWSWDADFFDFDLDGDDDLFVLNGMNEYMVYSDTPYYTSVGEDVQQVVLPVSEKEPNVFFLNEEGRLRNASESSGLDYVGNSRSAAYFDLEGDGDLDVIVNNYHGPALVYRNEAEKLGREWMAIRLEGDPSRRTNRDAIGARIIVRTEDGLRVWREIHGSEGYLSVHPREQYFGLGNSKTADAEIRWPNGEVQIVRGLAAGKVHLVRQASLVDDEGDGNDVASTSSSER